MCIVFFFQAEDGIRDYKVTGVQTCALPISGGAGEAGRGEEGHRLRLADPLVHAAAVPAGQGRADRIRDGRRATRARRRHHRLRGGLPGAAGADERRMSGPLLVAGSPLQMFTPWPPARTGVAHYASMLVPALRKRVAVEVIDRQQATGNGQRIYQLGNNPHHAWIYDEAMGTPGVI